MTILEEFCLVTSAMLSPSKAENTFGPLFNYGMSLVLGGIKAKMPCLRFSSLFQKLKRELIANCNNK